MSGVDIDGFVYVDLRDPLRVQGQDYNIRLTRTSGPRRKADDGIVCHVDYQRISDNDSGRFVNYEFEARGDNQSSLTYLQGLFLTMLNNDTPVISPVYV